MRLGQMSGRRQIALSKQDKHLCGSDLRYPMYKVILAHGLHGLRYHSGRAGHITTDQFQAGEKHLRENISVDHAVKLSRQLQGLLPVLLSGLQVVLFVEYAGQTKMRFVFKRLRMITCQLQATPKGLGRLAYSYGFGIGLTGRGTVPLDLVSKPQRPDSSNAGEQVVWVQILQGAARLSDHGFWLVAGESQSGPCGGNLSNQVAGLVVDLGALQGCFSSL